MNWGTIADIPHNLRIQSTSELITINLLIAWMVLQKVMSVIWSLLMLQIFQYRKKLFKRKKMWGRTSLFYLFFWFVFCNMKVCKSFVFFFYFFCYMYFEFCISMVGEQNYSRGSMPGVHSVAVVGQINLAHQPPSVSQVFMKYFALLALA